MRNRQPVRAGPSVERQDARSGNHAALMHSVNGRQGAENPLSRDHEHNQNGSSEGVYPHPLIVISGVAVRRPLCSLDFAEATWGKRMTLYSPFLSHFDNVGFCWNATARG